MFNDIILESELLNNPELIEESSGEINHMQRLIVHESSYETIMGGLTSNLDIMVESDVVETERKSFIKRMIDFFKKMIARIREWLDKRFNLTERNLKKITDLLTKKENYLDIEVEAYQGINNLDPILNKLEVAAVELKDANVTQIVDTMKKKGLFKGYVSTGVQLVRGTYLDGYVPPFDSYNNLSVDKIKEEVFGRKVVQKGIDVTKFPRYIAKAKRFKDEITKYNATYEKFLTAINKALGLSNTFSILGVETQASFERVVGMVTQFYNRNISLITSLTVEAMNAVLSTAVNMAAKRGIRINVGSIA